MAAKKSAKKSAKKPVRKAAKKSAPKRMVAKRAMPNDKDLNDLFHDTLKDIYFAEKQILKALPKMAKAAQSADLVAAFKKHHGETEGQVDRLEQVFALIDKPAKAKTCDAIMGILDEGKEIMDEYKGTEALDAGLLAAAQAVEHYEISRYGTLKAWATKLGMTEAARLLDETLQQEHKTDVALTTLALAEVNTEAMAA
jgi:ferritin-like metal-binding protein YciE